MAVTAKSYSKGRRGSGKAGQFEGDSKDKEKAVSVPPCENVMSTSIFDGLLLLLLLVAAVPATVVPS